MSPEPSKIWYPREDAEFCTEDVGIIGRDFCLPFSTKRAWTWDSVMHPRQPGGLSSLTAVAEPLALDPWETAVLLLSLAEQTQNQSCFELYK